MAQQKRYLLLSSLSICGPRPDDALSFYDTYHEACDACSRSLYLLPRPPPRFPRCIVHPTAYSLPASPSLKINKAIADPDRTTYDTPERARCLLIFLHMDSMLVRLVGLRCQRGRTAYVCLHAGNTQAELGA